MIASAKSRKSKVDLRKVFSPKRTKLEDFSYRDKVWTTQHGVAMKLRDMRLAHLTATLALVCRRVESATDEYKRSTAKSLEDSLMGDDWPRTKLDTAKEFRKAFMQEITFRLRTGKLNE